MKFIRRLDRFHKSRSGYAIFGATELLLAYIFGSWAIDTASMWFYLLTIVFTVGAALNFIGVIRGHKIRHLKRKVAGGRAGR